MFWSVLVDLDAMVNTFSEKGFIEGLFFTALWLGFGWATWFFGIVGFNRAVEQMKNNK